MGVDFDSPVLNYSVIDQFVTVSDDESFAMLKHLAKNVGLLVGPSSGAVAAGAQKYIAQLEEPFLAVMICGDSGRAYLSKNLYQYDTVQTQAAVRYVESTPTELPLEPFTPTEQHMDNE